MSVYPFIEAEKVAECNVSKACTLLSVSRSAYSQWHKHLPSARALSDAGLGDAIVKIHEASRGTFGAPRITAELRRQGIGVGKKRVARLMTRRGLVGRAKRRWTKTTIPDPGAQVTALDRLGRAFAPEAYALDSVYVGDITYIRTHEGWLYLATTIDLASRRVVGFAMADHMRASLVCDALAMALGQRHPDAGLIVHTDRGSQYTSREFRALLDAHGLLQSLSRPRQCWDNAVAESFFATLKEELVHRRTFPTRTAARPGDLRVHRGLLQPSPAAFHPRLPHPRRVRARAARPGPEERPSGIVNPSVESGQVQPPVEPRAAASDVDRAGEVDRG